MTYSVGEVARMVGVSVRTLHHYDEIGLLRPTERTKAGYRRYGEAAVARLHQILAYRKFGFDLARIAMILDDPSVDAEEHLQLQRALLKERVGKLEHMLGEVEVMMNRTEGRDEQATRGAPIENEVGNGGWRHGAGVTMGFGLVGAVMPWVLREVQRSAFGVQPLFAYIALFSLVGLVCAGTVLAYGLRGRGGHLLFQRANASMWIALVAVSYLGVTPIYGYVGAFVGVGAAFWGSVIVALQTRRSGGAATQGLRADEAAVARSPERSEGPQLRLKHVEPLAMS